MLDALLCLCLLWPSLEQRCCGGSTLQQSVCAKTQGQQRCAGLCLAEALNRQACALQSTYSGPPRLVVFGGNGFVGSRVCQEGLKTGLAVASVNRSGAPKLDEPWVREVEWVRVSGSCTCGHQADCHPQWLRHWYAVGHRAAAPVALAVLLGGGMSCSCTLWAPCPMLLVIRSEWGTGMHADTVQPDLRRMLSAGQSSPCSSCS